VLIDIGSKRKAKKEEKKISDNLKTEGKNADQLKEQVEEVEKNRGQQSYENNKSGVNTLKEELFKKVGKEEYLRIIVDSIDKFLLKSGVDSNELNLKNRKHLQGLKKGGGTGDLHRISQVEEEIVKDAGQKGAQKKIGSLFEQAETALRTGEKIKEIKNKLNNFVSSSGVYEKDIASQKAKEIESYLTRLEDYSPNHFQSPSESSFP
jgi:hypothetical protein